MFIVGTLKVCECRAVGFVDDSMPFIVKVEVEEEEEGCTVPAIAETDLKPVATTPLVFPAPLTLALATPPLTGAGGALIVGFLLSKTGGFSVSGVMVIGTFETLTPNCWKQKPSHSEKELISGRLWFEVVAQKWNPASKATVAAGSLLVKWAANGNEELELEQPMTMTSLTLSM
ncbi:hypothetical protein WICPIJ_000694 [Wickerhamomyces pijperi]|uniref:Uncharacterized protein n=1 Tax=Wickerhamomyces pijperi TaxID=599730 RepID=A0A9P8QGA1_WICPI|nr:hypothetical protein WICPIJ_000694 [Wickerhamomyces pijperi]